MNWIISLLGMSLCFIAGSYWKDRHIRLRIAQSVRHVHGDDTLLVGNALNSLFCLNILSDSKVKAIIEDLA